MRMKATATSFFAGYASPHIQGRCQVIGLQTEPRPADPKRLLIKYQSASAAKCRRFFHSSNNANFIRDPKDPHAIHAPFLTFPVLG